MLPSRNEKAGCLGNTTKVEKAGELGIVADNCQMPGLSFMLSLPTWRWPATLDPDSVPSGARIDRVLLDRAHPPSDSLVPC